MTSRRSLYFVAIGAAVAVLFVSDIVLGSVSISAGDVWRALFGGADEAVRAIIVKFRLPKAVVALVVGAGLAASGLQMQTLFRNPLAGPYVLGSRSGASLGVALFLRGAPLLGGVAGGVLYQMGIVGSAWVGAALILVLILAVSVRLKDIMAILILGMMFGSAATAFVDILQYVSPDGAVKSFVVWTMGSLGGVSGQQLWLLVPVVAVGLGLSVAMIKPLNMLLLGENYARTMGLNIPLVRGTIFLSTTLLAGTITAFCGPIGFVGIAVPHLARMLFSQADHRVLMPASMAIGAAVMLLCDMVSQLPGHDMILPINTVTALLGIPVVIVVIVRNKKFF